MNDLDYHCICGHLAGQHAMEKTNIFKLCLMNYNDPNNFCRCDDFIADNLRYLESKSES